MPCIEYVPKRFGLASLQIVSQARVQLAQCQVKALRGVGGTDVYYQFVSRDLIANRQSEYKRLGAIINDARLAGLLDWTYITDRTRNLRDLAHWDDPSDIVNGAASQFRVDKWADQDYRVEVWIEKDALVGVLQSCCPGEDVPYFSCRGYTSQSEVWGAAQRLGHYIDDGKKVVVRAVEREESERVVLTQVSDRWDDVKAFLAEGHGGY